MTIRPATTHRVPAEHRLLGLDLRTFRPAIIVIAVFVVFTLVVPQINDAVSYDDPIAPGERLALSEDIVMTPPTGWNLEAGYRVGEDGSVDQSGAATVIGDGVTAQIRPGTFDGTPAELIKQVAKVTSATDDPSYRKAGDQVTIATDSGETGVAQAYRGVNGDGFEAAFVIDGTGVEFTVYGNESSMLGAADKITEMLASLTTTDSTTDSTTASGSAS